MVDPAQIILLIVVVVLTLLLLVLGTQVFFILRDLRKTITKTNEVLDNANAITESVSEPLSSFSSIMTGLKTGAFFANLLKKNKHHRGEDDGEE